MSESRHDYVGIQVLRFVAAVLVVGLHATFIVHDRLDPHQKLWTIGWIGVPIFFVISGFVMVVSSQRLLARSDAWRRFLLRRAVRILPLYWIVTTIQVAVLVVAPSLMLHDTLNARRIVLSYLLLPSHAGVGNVAPIVGVAWTLLFEAFFYVVFAVGLRFRFNLVLYCGAVLSVAALGWLLRPVDSWPAALVYFDPVVLHFLGGVVIGTYVVNRRKLPLILGLSYTVGLYLAVWAIAPSGAETKSNPTYLLVALTLVLAAVWAQPLARYVPRLLQRLGDSSYSLYLFHPIIAPAIPVAMVAAGLVEPGPAIAAIVILLSLLSLGLYAFLERPITRMLQARLLGMGAPTRRRSDREREVTR